MPGYVLFNFFIYSVINAFTPGPGNILALNTVTNYGWKKGKPLFFGIFAGYYIVQTICCILVFGMGSIIPRALAVIKYIGAAYILWLAFHIAVSKPETDENSSSASFARGFLLQFVNVKIYLFGITALTGYVTNYSTAFPVLFGFEMFIASIGTVATGTWIAAGAFIRRFYERHFRVINIILALTLLECVWSILRT